MVADGNDHDSTPEDLFEDLDRFFTPIKELGPDIVDLTDSSVSAAASADPDEDESSPAGTEPRRPRDVDDFLPTGWASDVGAGPTPPARTLPFDDLDDIWGPQRAAVGAGRAAEPLAKESAGLRGASPPAGTSPPAGATGTGEPPRAAEGQDRPVDSAAGPQGPDEPARPGDRTSEVSPGDWSRLRDVLGEEEDEDDLTFAPDEADVPAGDSSLLSFDDLGVESEEPDQEAEGAASAPAEEPPEGLSSSAFPDPWTPQRDGEDAESPMMESPM